MKAKIKKTFWQIIKIDWRIWLVIFLACLAFSAIELRHNNLQMAKLRDAVYSADTNNKNVEQALDSLQSYVTSHMNTNLTTPNGIYPPIQLTATYKRLTTQASSTTYHDAQIYCEKHQPVGFYGAYRLGCVESYIESHPSTSGQKPDVPAALYQFNFDSPAWSPDAAGWGMAALAISFAGLVSSFFYYRIHRR